MNIIPRWAWQPVAIGVAIIAICGATRLSPSLPVTLLRHSHVLKNSNGTGFRDLNKNQRLDVYEDVHQPIEKRIQDLLRQMTLEEKAGMLFINGARINEDGSIEDKPGKGIFAFAPNAAKLLTEKKMNHFNLWAIPANPHTLAVWYNKMQQLAEASRLGIPITIASDPRSHFSNNIFAMQASGFSQWCEPLGLAAIGDPQLTRQFADMVRQEYLAVGIREALHPQVDLATEPRWPRISGTFGEDAQLSARMATAYILGFQGATLNAQGVATMTKHFSGGGPQREGLDPHFPFQRGQIYPGHNFKYHLIPFEAAFAAHTAGIMPYYGVPMGQTKEDVGFSYNKAIITDLLRHHYRYDGVVCTDWGLVTDAHLDTIVWPARAWGVEKLSIPERMQKIIDAGVDQFGGENNPEVVIQLVREGKVSERRIDSSVVRLLRQKFQLGLFDNPYVAEDKAATTVGRADFVAAGEASQRRAITLLKNDQKILPLKQSLKLYLQNIDPAVAARYGTVVNRPEDADLAIIRLQTPFYPVESNIPLAKMFHHGDLDFKGTQLDSILQLLHKVPTIVDIYLDRPAVIPEISQAAKGLLADFGASDAAVLDVIFGKFKPGGHLPIELPSSMDAVRAQKEDVPYDSKDPLYKFGFGLRYE
ncbi:beta-glucosidase [Chitinophaga costaii]|uniref:beta-glucosidase n=1 Tax=Chitinophaga costaii TaxID=1335309 RepID=A0A1C4C8R5_9BACT|nr:glycoside hydrolase family 3 N-terminal domain-containing protein [Chitinophaga costaii]PUZ27188.1 glycoside hydrolase family 3 protein [Chitinophaga costaii]SCC15475.1 beta-glucosidase [Chitinophaga costaii]